MNTTTEQMDRASQTMTQLVEALQASSKDFMAAATTSMTVLTKGCEEWQRSAGSLMQENMARTVSFGKMAAAARNPREWLDACTDFQRECMDSFMASSGKLSELSARTTKEAIEPVAQQASATISKMTQQATRAA